MLVEWLALGRGSGAMILALLSARAIAAGGGLIVISDPAGEFHAPAAAALGLNPQQILVIRPPNAVEELWALDQSLRCEGVAIVWATLQRLGDHDFRRLELNLPGAFQFNNSAIAIVLFLLWLQREQPCEAPDRIEASVRTGLCEARWPGRLEIVSPDPLTMIDVGHTPDGIRQSLASLIAIHGAQDWILVTGASRDKKADEIVGALAPSFDTIICTTAHHKGADAQDIAAAAKRANPTADICVAATIGDAVRVARELAKAKQQRIYVAGGLFLAIEYATVAKGGRAEDLKFF
jgi:folylpolyglutamate synthase/dihydropteroate synthase